MTTKSGSTSTLKRCIKAPMKALCKLRDLYVKSMTSCAGNMNQTSLFPSNLPKSFSGASSKASEDDEDLREVMRMVSQKSQRQKAENSPVDGYYSKRLPKSFSVGIGRIDEDKPCYFEEDVKVKSDVVLFPRSKSHAVTKRVTGMYSS